MFSLALSNEDRFLVVSVHFPALSFGLFCEFVCGTGRALHIPLVEMSPLQQECLPGGSDYICWRGLVLQMTSWKYLHCPFSYPKATSNEIKTRILKFSLTICGESEKSPGEWKSYPLQYSGLDNSMDCKNHGTAKSLTRLSTHNVPFCQKNHQFFYHFSDWPWLWTPKEWEEVDKEED